MLMVVAQSQTKVMYIFTVGMQVSDDLCSSASKSEKILRRPFLRPFLLIWSAVLWRVRVVTNVHINQNSTECVFRVESLECIRYNPQAGVETTSWFKSRKRWPGGDMDLKRTRCQTEGSL
jgi:hypothetical protein